ncbi:ADP-ribosylglycohydrolase family protein [Pedosphaera parvula]|nr:ADP-ribosylglycohydrolase family protein [Pedosphaera parvula]
MLLITPPDGETRRGLYKALRLPVECSVQMAAVTLGNGSQVISSDTVPFTLWCAARYLHDYQEALWTTVAGYGDRDTTCAIVGGIVNLSTDATSIPAEWRDAREPLFL